jgi:hypothetical protein
MRYIPPIHQNTKGWNGVTQEDKDVFMHAAGDILGEPEIAARRPDAQHWGMEIRALAHGGGEEI